MRDHIIYQVSRLGDMWNIGEIQSLQEAEERKFLKPSTSESSPGRKRADQSLVRAQLLCWENEAKFKIVERKF